MPIFFPFIIYRHIFSDSDKDYGAEIWKLLPGGIVSNPGRRFKISSAYIPKYPSSVGDTFTTFKNGAVLPKQSSRLNNDATYAYQKSCPLVGAVSQIKK